MTLPHSLLQVLTSRGENDIQVQPINNGLIHQTFRVTVDENNYLLQSINSKIFPNPEGLIKNHLALYEHFKLPGSPFEHALVQPLPFSNGSYVIKDENQQSWRLAAFVENSCTRSSVEDPFLAQALAEFFARFTQHATRMDPTDWHIPLPRFHDLSLRYDQFLDSIHQDKARRRLHSNEWIEQIIERQYYVNFYKQLEENDHFRKRMMHHDAKLSNVLIDEQSDTWICPIDLDTVMPGFFFSDLGDMVRSICNGSPNEDSPKSEVLFRSDLYEALLNGYRNGMSGSLTTEEDEQLDFAGILMTYMQAIRFLTDHLNGDVYYRIDRPGQNLERALNQFELLRQMEAYLMKSGRISIQA